MSVEETGAAAAEAAAANCDDECDIVRSNKGGPKLIHRGYIYTVHKQRPGFVRWRCTRRSLFCKGSMMTTSIEQGTTKKVLTPHNHVPDRHAVSVTIARGRQLETSATSGDPASPPQLEDNKSALDRLKNLGTAVQVKEPQHAHHRRKTKHRVLEPPDDEMPTLLDPHDWDGAWKPRSNKVKDSDMQTETKPPAPLKVSKRIMEKRQMQQLSKGDEYFSQIKGNKDTKMKIVKVTRGDGADVSCPIDMVQKQTASSLVVRKLPMQTPEPPIMEAEVEDDEVCLKWNSHHSNMQSAFPFLLAREQYVDVTLCSEGQSIRCHKLVLSACSTYFDEIISGMTPWQHPVIYLKGIPFWVLKALIDFMYVGEVSIEQSKLQHILDAGEELKIKGLTTSSPQLCTPFSYVQVPDGTPGAGPDYASPPASSIGGSHYNRGMSSQVKLGGHNLVPTKAPNVFKIALSRDHLTKLSHEDTNKLFKSTMQRNAAAPSKMVSLLNKNAHAQQQQQQQQQQIKEEKKPEHPLPVPVEKDKPAKQVHKRPAKRRLSEANESPLPDHLQFVRKGTRSRPLVKTPKIYQTEVSPKRELRERSTPVSEVSSSSFATITPQKNPSPEKPPVLKPVSLLRERPLFSATSDTPFHHPPTFGAPVDTNEDDYLQITQIKEEPIDISETDVSYGNFLNEEHVLRFDEDEPGEHDEEDDLLLGGDGSQEEEFMEVITPTMEQDSEQPADEVCDDEQHNGNDQQLGITSELQQEDSEKFDELTGLDDGTHSEVVRRNENEEVNSD